MNTNQLQAWLQLVSNVGVIIGLVLVAVQIKQNSDLASLELVASAMTQETDHINILLGENPTAVFVRARSNPDELTPAEKEILANEVEWWLSMMRRNAALEQGGIWDDEWRSSLLPLTAMRLASDPVSKAYLLEQPTVSDWMKDLHDRVSSIPPPGSPPMEPAPAKRPSSE